MSQHRLRCLCLHTLWRAASCCHLVPAITPAQAVCCLTRCSTKNRGIMHLLYSWRSSIGETLCCDHEWLGDPPLIQQCPLLLQNYQAITSRYHLHPHIHTRKLYTRILNEVIACPSFTNVKQSYIKIMHLGVVYFVYIHSPLFAILLTWTTVDALNIKTSHELWEKMKNECTYIWLPLSYHCYWLAMAFVDPRII